MVLEITAKKMETQIYFVKMSFRCYKIIGVTIFSQKILLPVSVRENEQKQMRRHFNTKQKTRIIAKLEEGWSLRRIAADIGVSYSCISKI